MTQISPLVTLDWLRNPPAGAEIVLLDASVYLDAAPEGQGRGEIRSGVERFTGEGHIPGARFADLITEFSDPASGLPFTLPKAAEFAAACGRLGITPESHVVIYDGIKTQWAARLWWVFRQFGHARVSVLDGGLKHYLQSGGSLSRNPASYAKTRYPLPAGPGAHADTALVADVVRGDRPAQLLCLLQARDFRGEGAPRARRGHIPGSGNLPFEELVDPVSNLLLPPEALAARFRQVVPLAGELIITYCGGGVASTLGALALAILGYEQTLEYDGSLAEWLQDPARPLAIEE